MVVNNTNSAKEFKKYFELFNETIEFSNFFTQNSKDFMQEKFAEISDCIQNEITKKINVVDPVTVIENQHTPKL